MTLATISDILDHAQENQINEELLLVPELEVGDYIPQGDINLIVLPSVPPGALLVEEPSKQIVVGNSKGSRHCLNSLENVRIYRLPNPNALQSIIIEFLGETILEHPEHKNQLWKKGVVIVSHQRQRAGDLRKIAD